MFSMDLNSFQQSCVQFSAQCVAATHQAASTTDIGGWSVNDLTGHLVMVNLMCANSLQGKGPETLPPLEDVVGTSLSDAFSRTSSEFVLTFANAADINRDCPTPVGIFPAWVVQTQGSLEHLIHGVDLSRAAGLGLIPSEEIVADAATRILQNTSLYDTFRSMGMYTAPLVAAPNASALDRLLGYLGRH
jgi:uncharacterized protein (TIGR03086 family)